MSEKTENTEEVFFDAHTICGSCHVEYKYPRNGRCRMCGEYELSCMVKDCNDPHCKPIGHPEHVRTKPFTEKTTYEKMLDRASENLRK